MHDLRMQLPLRRRQAGPSCADLLPTLQHSINPADTDANILRAEACDQWVHEALDRNKVVHPDHTYHYDKWQDK